MTNLANNSLDSAHNWVERLTVTIDTPEKNSKLLSALSKSIDNSVEAYGNEEYIVAVSSLETATFLAESLIEKDWTNQKDEQKLNEYIIPALQDALEELQEYESESVLAD